ncbi:Cytochrome b561 [Thalassocella blandensis]|nr:Cytochrome b561 [Thalassocella blandensis]
MIKNSSEAYGWVSIALHWITAVTVVGLFALGLWMMSLDYYDTWYKKGPDLHRSIGVLLVLLVIFRLVWRLVNPKPADLPTHKKWEKVSAHIAHWLFYILIILMFPTGYFITTAEGQSLYVFDWFAIPSSITGVDLMADISGEIHEIIAFTIIGLAVVHALGALKHHFLDKDSTLKRMLGFSSKSTSE